MPFPIKERLIEETEKKIGARFPDSFRRKMMIENGGEVDAASDTWNLHPFFDTSDKKHLGRTCNHILRETEVSKKWLGFPPNGLNLADNGTGNHLVFLISGDKVDPEVYLWNHETGELTLVVNDFSELCPN